eukprot:GHVL01010980.1.p1 GENE.GHVL01010980.1~~GHVL01010980.1.p1  ORF type:complete len:341 (+),score=81.57 GHVL01010980.1:31-1053(+)
MDKYRRVIKHNLESPDENEIRISATGFVQTYVSYAARLFNEQGKELIKIKATGTALYSAVTVTEIVKRRFKNLHQLTVCGSSDILDEFEPLEEGLDTVKKTRNVSYIEITLSKNNDLDTTHYGYQEPIPVSMVREYEPDEVQRGGRRGGRSGRGRSRGADEISQNDDNYRGRGSQRGGTQGFRRPRGGYRGNNSRGAPRGEYRGGYGGGRGRGGYEGDDYQEERGTRGGRGRGGYGGDDYQEERGTRGGRGRGRYGGDDYQEERGTRGGRGRGGYGGDDYQEERGTRGGRGRGGYGGDDYQEERGTRGGYYRGGYRPRRSGGMRGSRGYRGRGFVAQSNE